MIAAMRRGVRPYKSRRPVWAVGRGGLIPIHEDGVDFAATADTVVEDPREPVIEPTGVLNADGDMILRVHTPIKQKMGFHSPSDTEYPDTVVTMTSAKILRVSDGGLGMSHVDASEIEFGVFDLEEAKERQEEHESDDDGEE